MSKFGLLVSYDQCDGCRKCVDACRQTHDFTSEQNGMKLSVSGPFTFPSGKAETYYVAIPTAFCDYCETSRDIDGSAAACVQVCPARCIVFGGISACSVP